MESADVRFGGNPNQVFHTFRHVDAMLLNRDEVTAAIVLHLASASQFRSGLYIGRVHIREVHLEFHAFRVSGQFINVGRITAVRSSTGSPASA